MQRRGLCIWRRSTPRCRLTAASVRRRNAQGAEMTGIDQTTPEVIPGDAPDNARAFQFSTDAFRGHERVAAWREVFGRALLNIDISPRSKEGFRASATIFRSSKLGVIRASTSAADQGELAQPDHQRRHVVRLRPLIALGRFATRPQRGSPPGRRRTLGQWRRGRSGVSGRAPGGWSHAALYN